MTISGNFQFLIQLLLKNENADDPNTLGSQKSLQLLCWYCW